MATFEPGMFCGFEEYASGLDRRILPAQLRKDDLYTVMMRLSGQKWEAAKKPVRLLDTVPKTAATLVRFAFLDDELNPEHKTVGLVNDGILGNLDSVVVLDTNSRERYTITQAYFKDYFDDQFGDLLEMSRAADLINDR